MGDIILPPIGKENVRSAVWNSLIPAVPTSGSYGEKFKNTIIRYEVVGPTVGTVSVAAGAISIIYVQPPVGETWEIFAGGAMDFLSGNGTLRTYDGVTSRSMIVKWGDDFGGVQGAFLITNSIYLEIYHSNPDTVAHSQFYSYAAFKVKSSPIPEAKLIPTERPLEEIASAKLTPTNPHSAPTLPDWCKPLEKYAFVDPDGDIAISLEKDVPLRKDEKGNVIERLTVYCKLKDFERLFAEEITDTAKRPLMMYIRSRSVANKMGWEKYIDKWREEGIKF